MSDEGTATALVMPLKARLKETMKTIIFFTAFVISLVTFLGILGFTGYGIYQFFCGEYAISMASVLIAILLERLAQQLSPLLKLPSEIFQERLGEERDVNTTSK